RCPAPTTQGPRPKDQAPAARGMRTQRPAPTTLGPGPRGRPGSAIGVAGASPGDGAGALLPAALGSGGAGDLQLGDHMRTHMLFDGGHELRGQQAQLRGPRGGGGADHEHAVLEGDGAAVGGQPLTDDLGPFRQDPPGIHPRIPSQVRQHSPQDQPDALGIARIGPGSRVARGTAGAITYVAGLRFRGGGEQAPVPGGGAGAADGAACQFAGVVGGGQVPRIDRGEGGGFAAAVPRGGGAGPLRPSSGLTMALGPTTILVLRLWATGSRTRPLRLPGGQVVGVGQRRHAEAIRSGLLLRLPAHRTALPSSRGTADPRLTSTTWISPSRVSGISVSFAVVISTWEASVTIRPSRSRRRVSSSLNTSSRIKIGSPSPRSPSSSRSRS